MTSPRAGYVCALGAEAIGRASHVLGAGREKLGDPVDHAVGVVVRAHPGARVEAGQPIVELHHRDGRGVDEARRLVSDALVVGDEAPVLGPTVIGEVR